MRAAPTLAVALVVLSAGCLGGVEPAGVAGSNADPDAILAACPDRVSGAAEDGQGRADPPTDRLGWEDGVWYDDPIAVDQADGLDCVELALALARTMARVEHLRGLEFASTPHTRVIDRETYRGRATARETATNVRTMRNVVFEALFMVDERTDAVAVQHRNDGTSVAAYYLPGRGSIVIVTPDPERVQISAALLAHELVHALQDQHFERVPAGRPTTDVAKGRLGLTEGDANYVQYRYRRRCAGDWQGTCLVRDPIPARSPPGSGSGLANVGMYLINYQPYSDGPAFVERLREADGWRGVNDAYRRLPESTEQTIHPERYPRDRPTEVSIPDTSTAEWRPLATAGEPDAETIGEAGLFAMFMYPYYDSDGRVELVPAASFRNRDERGEPDTFDPYDYRHAYSEGWDGDRLVAYWNEDGEHAYVWALAFDSRDDAGEFVEGYRALLAYHRAERVEGHEHVWRIEDGTPFADAFAVERTGDRVVIVNAPTVEDLADVRAGT